MRALLGLAPFKTANALMVKWKGLELAVSRDSLSHGYLRVTPPAATLEGRPSSPWRYPWLVITGRLGVNPDGRSPGRDVE